MSAAIDHPFLDHEPEPRPLWERALDERAIAREVAAIRSRSRARRTTLNPLERRLARQIAEEHGITVELMLGRSRSASIARARQHFTAVLRWSTGLSLPDIGALLHQDHSTVMASVKAHEDRLNGSAAE